MNPFLLQLVAATLFAVALVRDKYNLRYFKIPPPDYAFMVFIGLVGFAGLASLFTFDVRWATLAEPRYGLGLAALIGLAFLWNKLFYHFERQEQLQDFEVVNLTVPAVTAAIGGLVFPEERSWPVFLAVGVAMAALLMARVEKRHLYFSGYSWLILFMVVVMAVETVLRKYLLAVFDPATFYFVRTTGVLALLWLFYRPGNLRRHSWRAWLQTLFASLLGTIAMIIFFYGYRDLGVVLTTFVFIASPLVVYFLDARLMRERIHLKNIVASAVILAAIVAAAVYG